jgi:hypothetical protein
MFLSSFLRSVREKHSASLSDLSRRNVSRCSSATRQRWSHGRTSAELRRRLAYLEQAHRIEPDSTGDAFDAAQRQVVLATLDAAEIGPVDADDVRKSLLTEALRLSIGPEIPPDGQLKFTFHVGERSRSAAFWSTESYVASRRMHPGSKSLVPRSSGVFELRGPVSDGLATSRSSCSSIARSKRDLHSRSPLAEDSRT